MRAQTIGIASGKGGVGKTTTAANLGVYYARRGIPTAIIDLDPLSDLGTLFDLEEPEHAGDTDTEGKPWRLAPHLDLLFPKAAENVSEKSARFRTYAADHAGTLLKKYRILIIDLPAGGGEEENLSLLPYIGQLVVVTNPEPTAHVSAGSYLHMVMENDPHREVYLWHNRFSLERTGEFNPRDVVGNYHRNADRSSWITDEFRRRIHDTAFVPADPSLNLLYAENPSPRAVVFHGAKQSVLHIIDGWLGADSCPLQQLNNRLPKPIVRLIRGCISRRPAVIGEPGGIDTIAAYIDAVTGAEYSIGDDPVFQEAMSEFSQKMKEQPLWREGTRALDMLSETAEQSVRMFSMGNQSRRKHLDNTLVKLMYTVSADPDLPRLTRNSAGMLLFQFAAAKLLDIPKVRNLILELVPHRKNPHGKKVRDRRLQIQRIVEQDRSYRKRYLKLLRTAYPLFSRQIDMVVKTFELESLLFRTDSGEVYKQAYVTMLSQLIHDILYSGMGIVVGFSYRSATDAFAAGAEILFEQTESH